eukprot:scaffold34915_cov180-Amphora_coffeaeformis.AAC.24
MCAPSNIVEDKQAASFVQKTITMSAGRFVANMAGLAFFVFLATAQFYAPENSKPLQMGAMVAAPSAAEMIPIDAVEIHEHAPNHTSRSVVIKSGLSRSTPDVASSSTDANHEMQESRGLSINMGNVASEVGIIVALQAIFPVVNRVIIVAKRVKWASLGVRVSPGFGRILKTFGNIWHTLMMGYKKTSASKIVTRTKKMVKIYQHSDDHHHDDHGHEHHEEHADRHDHVKAEAQHA